ncbi:hypothetical protein R6Q57_029972 [Mikania cordata]
MADTPSAELLEFPKEDYHRLLHALYRVGDLERNIKFSTEAFAIKLLRKGDVPEEKYSNAFLGFGPEDPNFAVELTYNYGVDKYDIGTGFGHFAIATADVYKLAEDIKAKGGTFTRETGSVKGGTSVIAFAKDPDCWTNLYTLAMIGYAEEKETIVLELTYNYDVTEYTKGNAYAQVLVDHGDLLKEVKQKE